MIRLTRTLSSRETEGSSAPARRVICFFLFLSYQERIEARKSAPLSATVDRDELVPLESPGEDRGG